MGLSTRHRSQIGVPTGMGMGHGDETHTCEYPSVTLLFWLPGSSSHLRYSFLDRTIHSQCVEAIKMDQANINYFKDAWT